FYLRTGKRLAKRVSEIAIRFRRTPHMIFRRDHAGVEPNLLAIRIQPDEGISLTVVAKEPGPDLKLAPVTLDFKYGEVFGAEPPEAYERLLLDAIHGDATLYALVPVALALVVVAVAPAAGAGRDSTGGATRAPQFADYPAGAVFRGTPAAPDFKRNPAAERFGTLLREGARRGPNFAGHLRVVEWSCGASCQSWMIVNTKTGRIQDAPEPAAFGLDFQLTSRLLIVNTFARFKAEDPP